MAKRIIVVTDYGVDSGQGRVRASYDNGRSYEEIRSEPFDTVDEALGWVQNLLREEAFDACDDSEVVDKAVASGVSPVEVPKEVRTETEERSGAI